MVSRVWFSEAAQRSLREKAVAMDDATFAVAKVLAAGYSALRLNGVALFISSVEGGIGALLREELPDDEHNRAKLARHRDQWVPW